MLKIGTWYNSASETLFNLGLPRVRGDGDRGFLTYEDGRLHEPWNEEPEFVDPRLIM